MADSLTIKNPDQEDRKALAKAIMTDLWHDYGTCDYAKDTDHDCVFCGYAILSGDPEDDDQVSMMTCVIDEVIKRLQT